MQDPSGNQKRQPVTTRSGAPQPGSSADRIALRGRKTAAAGLSVLSNTLLVGLKFGVGFWTGSVGVLAEAVHSLADLMAAGIAFISVRVSDAPPDADHPYGHGKVEGISGLAEAALIAVGAIFIVVESLQKLISSHRGATIDVGPGLIVMALSAVVNTVLSAHLIRTARATDSLALEADARHLRSDVFSSLGVFVGLLLVRLTGRGLFDPLTGLVVSLLIVRTAWKLMQEALHPLMDARLPNEEEAAIRGVLDEDPRVLGYHKLRTRKSGSQRHADVHVQVNDHCTLVEAHDLTEELEDRIREALPAIYINIHTEPYEAEMRHQREAHGVSTEEGASRVTKHSAQGAGEVRHEQEAYAVAGPRTQEHGGPGDPEPRAGAQ
jgi:cation diffusion facilitator family transporter